MAEARSPRPVKLICAVLAGREEWLQRAAELLQEEFGAIDLTSETWPFNWTDYYETAMGPGLLRRIHSFRELTDAESIAAIKHITNRLEQRIAAEHAEGPKRPVNLDPGYVTESKLVLATTKDYSHRIYLRAGIYAEVTLHWHHGAFESWEWTYPDYRSDSYCAFFAKVRALYRQQCGELDPN